MNFHTITIYQIAHTGKCPYAFNDFHEDEFDINDYEQVFKDAVDVPGNDIWDFLEGVFILFNSAKLRADQDIIFTGHSLSVSDVVKVEGHYYYVECMGFTDITEYVRRNKNDY